MVVVGLVVVDCVLVVPDVVPVVPGIACAAAKPIAAIKTVLLNRSFLMNPSCGQESIRLFDCF